MVTAAEVFKALGEPTRLGIVEYLLKQNGCLCVCDLVKKFDKDQSVIYRHIQILEKTGVLHTNKDANKLMCCVADKKRIKNILKAV